MAKLLRPRRRHAMACCSIVWLLSSNALTLTQAQLSRTTKTSHTKSCERLKTSLTYTQEKAPRDISGVVRITNEGVYPSLHANQVKKGKIPVYKKAYLGYVYPIRDFGVL